MRLYLLLQNDPNNVDDMPWVVDADDEYAIENRDGFTDSYITNRAGMNVRELIVEIPDKAVNALFESPTVKGVVVPPEDAGHETNP